MNFILIQNFWGAYVASECPFCYLIFVPNLSPAHCDCVPYPDVN